MARSCAYCGDYGPLTHEHIWPNGIIDRTKFKTSFTPRGKVISGAVTIADVCMNCNNGPLSVLDEYICTIYDHYFHQLHDRDAKVEFHYDWCLLGNWFLKASYNAARAAGNKRDTQILSRFTDFILGNDPRQPDLAIWVDLTEPSYLAIQSQSGIFVAQKMMPLMTRLAKIAIPDTDIQHYTLRMVAINSFYFYLAIPVQPYTTPYMPELNRICEFFSLLTPINPEITYVTCKTTGIAFHNIIAPHFLQNEDAYHSYIDSQGDT